MTALEVILTVSGENYLVHKESVNEQDFNTVWTVQILRGLLLAVVLLLTSFGYGLLSGTSYLEIGFCLSFVVIIDSLRNSCFSVYIRRVDFSKELRANILATIASLSATLIVAIFWRDHRALLAGYLASSVTTTWLTYHLISQRPSPSLASWRELFGFSIWLNLANSVTAIAVRLDALILSRLVGDQAVGIFTMARNVATAPTNHLVTPLNSVLFPGLAEVRADRDRFLRLYLQAQSVVILISLPTGAGLYLVADDLVLLLLGPQWSDAVVPVKWIAVTMSLQMTSVNVRNALIAFGYTKTIFKYSLLYAPPRLALFAYGAMTEGLTGAIIGYCSAGIILTVLENTVLCRTFSIPIQQLLRSVWRPFLATVGMVGICSYAAAWLPEWEYLTGILRMAAIVALGASSYTVIELSLWKLAGKPVGGESRFITLLTKDLTDLRRVGAN